MGGVRAIDRACNIHFCDPRSVSSTAPGVGDHNGRTPRPWLQPSDDVPSYRILRILPSSNPRDSSQLRNPLPPVNKISPPPMKHRDSHPHLMSSMGHLRSNQPDSSSNPLDVLLPIKRWQHQVPNPERQVVGQLSTKQIDPVAHKPFHGKMEEKLIRKLGNPSLAHPPLIMKLQNLLNLSLLPVRDNHVIGKTHHFKEGRLPALGHLLLTSNQRYR